MKKSFTQIISEQYHKSYNQSIDYYDHKVEEDEKVESNEDNFDDFMTQYASNIQKISQMTMKQVMGLNENDQEFKDPYFLESKICWMVEFNMYLLLKDGPSKKMDVKTINSKQVEQELKDNKMLSIHQDIIIDGEEGGQNHHFIIIGDNGKAHIVEYLIYAKECPTTYTLPINEMLNMLGKIESGILPDRFNDMRGKHVFTISSMPRRILSSKTVDDVLSGKLKYEK